MNLGRSFVQYLFTVSGFGELCTPFMFLMFIRLFGIKTNPAYESKIIKSIEPFLDNGAIMV